MDTRGWTRSHITMTVICIVVTVFNILINGEFLLNYGCRASSKVTSQDGSIRRTAELHTKHDLESLTETHPQVYQQPGRRDNKLNGLHGEGPATDDAIQISRLRQLNEACDDYQAVYRELTTHKAIQTDHSTITKTYNDLGINYCKVPKVGCTFMLQMFNILTNHVVNASEVFAMSRYSVHRKKIKNAKQDSHIFYSMPTILMARNPYSRLYSAYVDKIVLPSTLNDFIKIRDNSTLTSCKDRPSFQQFLEYIIEGVRTNETINSHWAPIYGMCKPCETDNIMIIKQESFADDIAVLLDYIGVSNKMRETITQASATGRASASVPGIILTTMGKSLRRSVHRQCLTKIDSIMFLWRSFQIQGFLRPNNHFPIKKFRSDMTSNTVVAIMMKEIETDAITSDERKLQRKAYLVDAYKDIAADVIEKIKSLYELDFLLFGYDMTPPM